MKIKGKYIKVVERRMIVDYQQYSADMWGGRCGDPHFSDGIIKEFERFLHERKRVWDIVEFRGLIGGEEKYYLEQLPVLRKIYKKMGVKPGYDVKGKEVFCHLVEEHKKHLRWQRSPAGRKAARQRREDYREWRVDKLAYKKEQGLLQKITKEERFGFWVTYTIRKALDYRGIMRRCIKITPIKAGAVK